MHVFRLISVILVATMLGACVAQSPPTQNHQVLDVPDGKDTKTIALAKIKSRVPKETHIGRVGEGWGCIAVGRNIWKAGKANITDSEMASMFFEELSSAGYKVLGNPDDLFENKAGQAEIAVGGLITDINWDICYPLGAWDGYATGTSTATLTVEWQAYNTLDKKTIFKTSKTGTGQAKFTGRQTVDGFRQAFADAVRGLLADKKFHTLVLDKEAQGALEDGNGGVDNASMVKSHDVTVTTSRVVPIPEIAKSVVVIQVPGGHGSGFFVGDQGYILTNHHVVGDRDKVRVLLKDGTKIDGVVLNKDIRRDVALVKVEGFTGKGLSVRPGQLAVGAEVYAIGAPIQMEMQGSVTKGIVSSYRTVNKMMMLQSDAAIYGGNSGGPLVDSQGKVVAICQSRMTATQGFNFFIPISEGLEKMGISVK